MFDVCICIIEKLVQIKLQFFVLTNR